MRKLRALLFCLVVLLVAALAGAQIREPGGSQTIATPPQPQSPGNANAFPFSTAMTGAAMTLGSGDLLDITVFDTPELTQKVRINSDGKIVLALIGEISVQQMSPDGLAEVIRRKLVEGRFVKNPQVSVFVAEYAGQMAYINGEVNRPGAYPLLRSHQLSDLIAVAGGLSSRAGNAITISRPGKPAATLHFDLADGDDSRRNPEILPGDNVTVGQTGIVYVLGNVQRPGGFLLDRRSSLSIVQAVALAEGTTPSAALTKATLIRVMQGKREEVPLNLKMILKSKSPDLALQAGDIIFVPGSLTAGLGRRSIDTVLATASGVAIYAYRP